MNITMILGKICVLVGLAVILKVVWKIKKDRNYLRRHGDKFVKRALFGEVFLMFGLLICRLMPLFVEAQTFILLVVGTLIFGITGRTSDEMSLAAKGIPN